jgi:hypothetical protein
MPVAVLTITALLKELGITEPDTLPAPTREWIGRGAAVLHVVDGRRILGPSASRTPCASKRDRPSAALQNGASKVAMITGDAGQVAATRRSRAEHRRGLRRSLPADKDKKVAELRGPRSEGGHGRGRDQRLAGPGPHRSRHRDRRRHRCNDGISQAGSWPVTTPGLCCRWGTCRSKKLPEECGRTWSGPPDTTSSPSRWPPGCSPSQGSCSPCHGRGHDVRLDHGGGAERAASGGRAPLRGRSAR